MNFNYYIINKIGQPNYKGINVYRGDSVEYNLINDSLGIPFQSLFRQGEISEKTPEDRICTKKTGPQI